MIAPCLQRGDLAANAVFIIQVHARLCVGRLVLQRLGHAVKNEPFPFDRHLIMRAHLRGRHPGAEMSDPGVIQRQKGIRKPLSAVIRHMVVRKRDTVHSQRRIALDTGLRRADIGSVFQLGCCVLTGKGAFQITDGIICLIKDPDDFFIKNTFGNAFTELLKIDGSREQIATDDDFD